MRLATLRPVYMAVTGLLLVCARSTAQEQPVTGEGTRPNFWRAAGGVVAVNGVTWFYKWHLQRWDWADVGTRSWWANLRDGFTWDDDAFGVNQIAHPYHGSLYYNAARESGYNFWASAPYVAAGSLSWELFTENVRPSLNDLINTTLGGIALGEVSHRVSSLLTSPRRATAGREVGAFLVNPISRAQALIFGSDRRRVFPPPESTSAVLSIGRQRGTGASPTRGAGHQAYVGLSLEYGSPFNEGVSRPYDAFEFRLQLSPNEHVVLTHASVSGLLTRHHLVRTPWSQILLGVFQHYDYDDLLVTKGSSQSLSGALLYRQTAGGSTHVDMGLHLELVPLAAVAADYDAVRRRDYDFGPGLGGRVTGALRHQGRALIRLEGRMVWIRSLYASVADHVMTTARVSARVPVMRMIGVGGDFTLTSRRSSYREHPHVRREVPQFRAYLTWSPS